MKRPLPQGHFALRIGAMMKKILTALLVVGKGSIKLISEFLGHQRHDKVWRWIRKIGRVFLLSPVWQGRSPA